MDRSSMLLPPLPPEPDYAAIRARLRAELPPALWADVWALILHQESATASRCYDEMHAAIEGIAQHFGCLGPLVRALAHHVHPELTNYNCKDGCVHPWPLCGPVGDQAVELEAAAAPDE